MRTLTDNERQLIRDSGLFDAAWYAKKYRDVAATALDPLDHFLRIGIYIGREPGPLFDSKNYRRQLEQISHDRNSESPLVDYLSQGWREGLNPNPFFDVSFYLENNSDVAVLGIEPLGHFIRFGSSEARNPHPIFDIGFYLDNNPDVAQSGVGPLQHFVLNGLNEGRAPNADFSAEDYLAQNPDVAKSGMQAAFHYAVYGYKENRSFINKSADGINAANFFWSFLEQKTAYSSKRHCSLQSHDHTKVSIIIPVYKGFEETINCINSVLESKEKIIDEIIVINDLSPDKGISDWLDNASKSGLIKLINHVKNKGFVSSVNEGIRLAGSNDVILLNSDTIVPQKWVSRLASHALGADKVGTVTAFSNNATICSWPSIQGGAMPSGKSVEDLDEAFYTANSGTSIHIPTAVGFCMYIKRVCINQVGIFDEEAFGLGYGEENDFCMRASSLGWTHLLACDTFVFHSGETSFGKESPSRSRAWEILVNRYPDYPSLVARHIEEKAADPYRMAATAALFRKSKEQTILFISHSLGGGTQRHINEIISNIASQANFLLLQPQGDGVKIAFPALEGHPSIIFNKNELNILIPTLRAFGVSRVHIHHWIFLNLELQDFVGELNLPFDFTVHDYFVICPRINLMKTPDSGYCGEPIDFDECDSCIFANPGYVQTSIHDWRSKNIWLLEKADRVICPSRDVRDRLAKYAPHANYVIAWHEMVEAPHWPSKNTSLSRSRPMRIGIIGVLAKHKGWSVVMDLARESGSADYHFVIIGYSEFPIPSGLSRKITETGKYEDSDLKDLISKNNVDLLWFPAQCPETYSYTLTAAINSGLPIAASDLGAFPERLSGRPQSWLLDPCLRGNKLNSKFKEIRFEIERNSFGDKEGANRYKPSEFFYFNNYINLQAASTISANEAGTATSAIKQENFMSLVVLPDRYDNGAITPCGYIRLVQPIDYLSTINPALRVAIADASQLPTENPDLFICQRHVVKNLHEAESIIEHCRRNNIKIVYDLDDDLVNIPCDHSEFQYLKSLSNVVVKFLKEADEVWVSTHGLKQKIKHLRNDAKIILNKHDHRIWLKKNQRIASSKEIRLVYMGTATHDEEYKFLETVAEQLHSKYNDQVTIDVVGATTRHLLPAPFRRIIPDNPSGTYHGFAGWFVNQNWDIGIAPLMANEFNECKSAIKIMDYAACGLTIIASPQHEYLKSFSHEHGIHYVENNAEKWVKTILLLIDDIELRRDSAEKTYSHYIKSHILKNNFIEYQNAVNQLIYDK